MSKEEGAKETIPRIVFIDAELYGKLGDLSEKTEMPMSLLAKWGLRRALERGLFDSLITGLTQPTLRVRKAR